MIARKLPKTVSRGFLLILDLNGVILGLSIVYLYERYIFRRPLPNWVPFVAEILLALSVVIYAALWIVPSTRSQLALLRSRTQAGMAQRRKEAMMYLLLISVFLAGFGYLFSMLFPQGADRGWPWTSDLALLAFGGISFPLLRAFRRFVIRP